MRAEEQTTEIVREAGGRLVREVWVEWAREQPDPKPSWLVGWDDLPEPDREVDRRIAERVGAAARADERERCIAALIQAAPPVNFGMSHDGREDPQASAYIEGWRDAWAALAQPADTEEADRG